MEEDSGEGDRETQTSADARWGSHLHHNRSTPTETQSFPNNQRLRLIYFIFL